MRFIQADILFPIASNPIFNGILVLNSDGSIAELIDPMQIEVLPDSIERFNGFLCPGFVNTHCHLELSHLKGRFQQKKGLVNFIDQMRLNRGGDDVLDAIFEADQEMQKNGIVAVGDISNNDLTLNVKKASAIHYHSFIEVFDVVRGRSEKIFSAGIELLEKFKSENLSASIAPHAPYTVTDELFSIISKYYFQHESISTIHNQETPDEDSMFLSQSGSMFDFLFGINPAVAERTHKNNSSLSYTLDHLHQFEKLLLVHNTFTTDEQIKDALDYSEKLLWCLCPNANLYIEDRLPDLNAFILNNCKITIGTDSLASNFSLSVLEELKTISLHQSQISLNELLKWATINGAEFLGVDQKFGSFQKGKKPSVVLIENVDVDNQKLKKDSRILLLSN